MRRPSGASGAALAAAPTLLAVTFLWRAAQNAGQTTYPLIGRDLLHMGSFAIGSLVAAAGVANVFFSTVVISRARKRPPAVLLAAGQVLTLAAFVLVVLPAGRAGLWVGAVALGAASGLVFPSLMTAIATASAGRRAKALAVMSVALSASLVAGPLVEAGVLRVLGDSLRAALGGMIAFPAGAAVLAVWWARRRPPAGEPRLDPAGPSDPVAAGETVPLVGLGPALPAVATGPDDGQRGATFRLALSVMLTYQVPFAALIAFGALLARQADGASASKAEMAFGVFFAASGAVRLLLTVAPVTRHIRGILAASAVMTVIGVGALGLARSFWELVVAMAVLGLPHGTTFPLASTILAEFGHADERELVRANGRLMAGTNGASILVPLLFGLVAAQLGYRAMFLLIEVPVVVAAGLLMAQLLSPRSPLRRTAGVSGPSPAAW